MPLAVMRKTLMFCEVTDMAKERYYGNDASMTYAIREFDLDNGKTVFTVYYDGWFAKTEIHEIKLYEWAKHLHGNAPCGTPYGYFRRNKDGKRIIITI